MTHDNDSIWDTLQDIKDELRRRADKFDAHVVSAAESQTHLEHLCGQIKSLNKLIVQGNGQESVLAKLVRLETEMTEVRTDLKDLVVNLSPSKSQAIGGEVAKAKWVAVGKIAGIVLLVIPGILAFLSTT